MRQRQFFMYDALFLLINFFELGSECSAAQVAGHNLALWVEEHIAGNAVHAVGRVGSTVPSLEVGHLRPVHAQVLDRFLPRLSLGVEAHADDLKALGRMVALIGFHHIGHLLTAGTAPGSPEIH